VACSRDQYIDIFWSKFYVIYDIIFAKYLVQTTLIEQFLQLGKITYLKVIAKLI